MGKEYTDINSGLQKWISKQHLFFVSTAPSAADGLINCSPKGLDCLRVLGPHELAYADTGGSGIETLAHLKDNGRITLMMCAFEGPPMIYRFYGTGTPVEPHEAKFDALAGEFESMPAIRNIIVIKVERIIDSCGYGVPMYSFEKHRDSLGNYLANQSDADILEYRRTRNSRSLEGLEGLTPPSPAD
ncbi:MAG: pyridoxamine 5'-phosphate oxidase family protein [Woeseiaceae bacterium]|nr:pyridoxamine 5'-phosphate oxidase family protein [Woeseiaceae bacterium]